MKRIALLLALVALIAGCKRKEEPDSARGYGFSKESRQSQNKQPRDTQETGVEVGAKMPEYSAMWLDGSKFEIDKHREKVVLLNLWATWCGPCRFEIPELQKMHEHYGPRGFEVIGVSVDESGVESVKQFVDEHEMSYPVVLDAEGKLASLLHTSVLPTSVLIDRNGTIVWKKSGAILENDEELQSAIEKAL